MIIKLQEAMRAYRRKTGEKMTYALLSQKTGIPKERVTSIGARPGYNATLADLNLICVELGADPGFLFEVDVAAAQRHRAKLLKAKSPTPPKKKSKRR